MNNGRWLHALLQEELKQREEEGCERQELIAAVEGITLESPEAVIQNAYDRVMALPIGADFPFYEPSDWKNIHASSPGFQNNKRRETPDLDNRMLGAWTGRCAGCALGKPVECGEHMMGKDGVPGWKTLRVYLRGASAWPLDDYIPDAGEIEGFKVHSPDSTRGKIRFMETDDDIRYTILGLKVLEEKGESFSTADVAHTWYEMLPIGQTCTAERRAYTNLAQIIEARPLDQAAIDWISTYRNPYREWIGAQIRADGWAYGAAGDAGLGAEFGYRDAALSHVKNGIYGEMLFGAAIAEGFASGNTLEALLEALKYIPSRSRLVKDVTEAIEIGLHASGLDEMHEELWNRWGHYHGVHTNNNAALSAAAIAYGKDDFEKTVIAAVTGGWDTDCNGATVGSLWGAVYGFKAIPRKWTGPLNDTLYAAIPGFHPIAISECARRSAATARKIAG